VAESQQDTVKKTPSWLQLSFEQRTRYEHLTEPFRSNASGTEKHVPLRTRLRLEIGDADRPIRFLAELQDSRVLYEKETLYAVRANINETDFLQAHLQLNSGDFSSRHLKSHIQIGRFTMDLGKRRLVARNNMRNTTNAFDGVSWTLAGDWDWTIHTFFTRPVLIDPYSLDSSGRSYFWGAYFESTHYNKLLMDAYYFGIHDPEISLLRQRHSTLGLRLYKLPASGKLDYEMESSLQFGKIATLDHFAWHYHGELGFSFNGSWEPRISLHYDYASGDKDPTDDTSNRFYPLFGARGFEYAPTGIYGPVYRSNINTPGFRIELHPANSLQIKTSYRVFRLAAAKDLWVGSGLWDPSGNSGKSIGHNLDTQLRWRPNRYFTFELGYARFFKGSYIKLVSENPFAGDSNYFYIATEFKSKLLPY